MKRGDSPRFFKTLPHACGYYPERVAVNIVIDPSAPNLRELYPNALQSGFRRSGGHLYRPVCPACRACVPTRIPVREFQPNRAQRRVLKRNADLQVSIEPARLDAEHLALYQRYLRTRHQDGGMDDADADDFENFLLSAFATQYFIDMRAGDRLLACAVTDVFDAALSSVYTFFEPDEAARSLGTFAILKQIERCLVEGRDYLYLGFWLDQHPKMDYKRHFRPQQHLLPDHSWQTVTPI